MERNCFFLTKNIISSPKFRAPLRGPEESGQINALALRLGWNNQSRQHCHLAHPMYQLHMQTSQLHTHMGSFAAPQLVCIPAAEMGETVSFGVRSSGLAICV